MASTGKPYEAAAVASMLGELVGRPFAFRSQLPKWPPTPKTHPWLSKGHCEAFWLRAEGQAVGHTQIAKPTPTPRLHRAGSKTSEGAAVGGGKVRRGAVAD